ncbi:MAG: hypothetical protein JW785_08705 [Acidimicrobiia bacterium]|nr:hypothetical protein [Acidimicrobiia bacterium]
MAGAVECDRCHSADCTRRRERLREALLAHAEGRYRAATTALLSDAEERMAAVRPGYPLVVFAAAYNPAAPHPNPTSTEVTLLFDGRWRWSSMAWERFGTNPPIPPTLGPGPVPEEWRLPPEIPDVGGSLLRAKINMNALPDLEQAFLDQVTSGGETGAGTPAPILRARQAFVAVVDPVLQRVVEITQQRSQAELEAEEAWTVSCEEVVARLGAAGEAAAPPRRRPVGRDGKLPTDPRLPKAPWWWEPEETPAAAGHPLPAAVAAAGSGPAGRVETGGEAEGDRSFSIGERREERFSIGSLGEGRIEGRVGVEGRLDGSFEASGAAVDGAVEGRLRAGATLEGEVDLLAGPATGRGSAEVFAGAEGTAQASGHVGPDGLSGRAGMGGFVGDRARASGEATALGVTAQGATEFSTGMGVHADVAGSATWERVGFEMDLGAALGIGGGGSFGVSVSPQGMWEQTQGLVSDLGGGALDKGADLVDLVTWW